MGCGPSVAQKEVGVPNTIQLSAKKETSTAPPTHSEFVALCIPASGFGEPAKEKHKIGTKLIKVPEDIAVVEEIVLEYKWDCQKLHDNPTKQEVREKIKSLFSEKRPGYLIYYSGHGKKGSGHWMLAENTEFSASEFGKLLKTCNISEDITVLLIADCCYAYYWTKEFGPPSQVIPSVGENGPIPDGSLRTTVVNMVQMGCRLLKKQTQPTLTNKGPDNKPSPGTKPVKCTFDECKDFIPQDVWNCLTCWGPSPALGICYACSINHHAGHNLLFAGHHPLFKCDCGVNEHANKCTRNSSGRKFIMQQVFKCRQCFGGKMNYGVCQPCAEVCHKGHKLIPAGISQFFCDCGDKGCSSDCKIPGKKISNKNQQGKKAPDENKVPCSLKKVVQKGTFCQQCGRNKPTMTFLKCSNSSHGYMGGYAGCEDCWKQCYEGEEDENENDDEDDDDEDDGDEYPEDFGEISSSDDDD